MKCVQCNHACSTCYGPTNYECLECSAGYVKSTDNSDCQLPFCSEGTYLKQSLCFPCDDSCYSCIGEGEYNCTSCSEGLSMISTLDGKTVCSKCPDGFKANSAGKCVGILLL